ncbi:MAG: penicillin acylase family protein [Halieaceae bacterium]|jgi:penicillin amidase|nr:penicillin acylase family protein [Halieaceae bacterium]
MLRTLTRLVVALLLLAALLAAAAWWALRASLPATEGFVNIPGLSRPVDLQYDRWQRPNVHAASLADALSAEGWLHASHRLWQMELYRRAGSGRMAELLGRDLLETDEQLWRFGVPQLAKSLQDNASPQLLALIGAYLRGINAAIESARLPPPEFLLLRHQPAPWTPADVFAVGALMAFQSSNNAEQEILRLAIESSVGPARASLFLEDLSEREDFPFVLQGTPAAGVAPQSASPGTSADWLAALSALDATDPRHQPLMPRLGFGSNGWVLAPERSETGHALFAFDSHDALGLPNLFYEVQLFFDGGRRLGGWSAPGLPGVINGFNESIAWGFTNIGDSQDLFLEREVPGRPGVFMDGDTAYAATVRTITVPVRDAPDHSFEVLSTRNGPLIHTQPPLSLRWTAHDIGELGLDGLLAFNLARNWTSFNAALDRHAGPVLNATYADVAGNIGFRTAGLLPQRSRGDGLRPLPADATTAWRGIVPAADMPRLLNPATGYIAAANARVNPPGSYPLVSAENAAPYRAARLQQVLGQERRFTSADMQALQMDWHDGQAALVLPGMLAAVAGREELGDAHALLSAWLAAPVASADSGAALLFQAWYLELADALFRPVLGEELYRRLLGKNYMVNFALDTLLLTDRHAEWWPAQKSTVLATSLAITLRRLEAGLGPMKDWRLDARQRVGLRHELSKAVPELALLLAVAPLPWGGSPAAVGRANYSYRRPFEVIHGATVRAVGEMAPAPIFQSVIPAGQSGHPLSPHYADQFPAWMAGDLLPMSTAPQPSARQLRLLAPASD